jgi:hypothetical protein
VLFNTKQTLEASGDAQPAALLHAGLIAAANAPQTNTPAALYSTACHMRSKRAA